MNTPRHKLNSTPILADKDCRAGETFKETPMETMACIDPEDTVSDSGPAERILFVAPLAAIIIGGLLIWGAYELSLWLSGQ